MAQKLSNKDVAIILNEIGTFLELKGDNPFKVRAYYNSARTIERLQADLSELIESGELRKIKGIGDALAKKIVTIVSIGSLPYYEDLKASIPSGLREMLRIPGLGVKKVRKLWQDLDITTLGELEYACNENRLITLEGFGLKTQEKVLEGINFLKKYANRFLLNYALNEANKIVSILKSHSKVKKVSVAGSVRRKKEIIKNIDIVAEFDIKDSSEVLQFLSESTYTDSTLFSTKVPLTVNQNHASIKSEIGMNVDIYFASSEEYPFILRYYTGSKEHNQELQKFAARKGFRLTEKNLFHDREKASCSSEEEIYTVLGLSYIPPELRENVDEIELAEKNQIQNLITEKDVKGCFHNHTVYSDGRATISEMVDKSRELGFEYLGISDHSQSAFYANGLSIERLQEQWCEIDELNEELDDFAIFKSVESDILVDGSLDYPDDILKKFDFVVASVHSHFKLSLEEQTERIINALNHPSVKILGHPTGRLLLSRDSYEMDMEKIIREATRLNVAIEINSNPHRLDLDWRWGKLASEVDLKVAINTDAHNSEGLSHVIYGVYMARKAGIPKENILNTWTVDKLFEFFKS